MTRQEIVPPIAAGLLAAETHPANGTLFPQPWVETATGARRMDEDAGTGWRVVWDGRQSEHPEPPANPGMRGITVGGAGLAERDGVLAAWFSRNACIGAIVRPDHYVYGVISQAVMAEPMLAALHRRLRGAPA